MVSDILTAGGTQKDPFRLLEQGLNGNTLRLPRGLEERTGLESRLTILGTWSAVARPQRDQGGLDTGSRHISHTGGPPSGRVISPMVSKPCRWYRRRLSTVPASR